MVQVSNKSFNVFSTSWPTEVSDILYVFWNEVLHEMWQKLLIDYVKNINRKMLTL